MDIRCHVLMNKWRGDVVAVYFDKNEAVKAKKYLEETFKNFNYEIIDSYAFKK